MFIIGLAALLPPYILLGMEWANFPLAWVFYSLTYWAFEGFAQTASVSPNAILGLLTYLQVPRTHAPRPIARPPSLPLAYVPPAPVPPARCQVFFAAFLFCGMFVPFDDVWWGLRWLCYFLPLGWGLGSFVHANFDGAEWTDDALLCDESDVMPTGKFCTTYPGQSQGFYCEDPGPCYGVTSDQIMESLGVTFPLYEDEGHYLRNALLILAFGVFMRVNYASALYALTMLLGGETPQPAREAGSDGTQVAAPASEPASSPEVAHSLATQKTMRSTNQGGKVHFSFTGIGYTVKPASLPFVGKPQAPKTILQGTSAVVSSGEVLAIVGPSGAGKTTLLNAITFTKGAGVPEGVIQLNGSKLDKTTYFASCAYVPREDTLWAMLTARQHLVLSYQLYRPDLSATERNAYVDDLLGGVGLTSAQHTRAGGLFFQGLSGGQRRRLSLAIALVKDPSVLILDEPTSGLDSAAAAAIIDLLCKIAKRTSAAIVCTIHQPSAAVFSGFSSVLVLAEGRTAYCGPRDDMATHFESIGKPLPKDANPAEAVLDLVSKDITSTELVTAVLDAWATAQKPEPSFSPERSLAPPRATNSCEWFVRTFHVLMRQLYLAAVDPMAFIVRLVMAPFMVAFFGLVYKETSYADQDQVCQPSSRDPLAPSTPNPNPPPHTQRHKHTRARARLPLLAPPSLRRFCTPLPPPSSLLPPRSTHATPVNPRLRTASSTFGGSLRSHRASTSSPLSSVLSRPGRRSVK